MNSLTLWAKGLLKRSRNWCECKNTWVTKHTSCSQYKHQEPRWSLSKQQVALSQDCNEFIPPPYPAKNIIFTCLPWLCYASVLDTLVHAINWAQKKLNQVNRHEQRSDGEMSIAWEKSKAEEFLENGKTPKPAKLKHTQNTPSNKTKPPQHTEQPRQEHPSVPALPTFRLQKSDRTASALQHRENRQSSGHEDHTFNASKWHFNYLKREQWPESVMLE